MPAVDRSDRRKQGKTRSCKRLRVLLLIWTTTHSEKEFGNIRLEISETQFMHFKLINLWWENNSSRVWKCLFSSFFQQTQENSGFKRPFNKSIIFKRKAKTKRERERKSTLMGVDWVSIITIIKLDSSYTLSFSGCKFPSSLLKICFCFLLFWFDLFHGCKKNNNNCFFLLLLFRTYTTGYNTNNNSSIFSLN